MKLVFTLPDRPVPKERPRRVQIRNGQLITYTPKKTKRFEGLVRAEAYLRAREQGWPQEYTGPVRAIIILTFPNKQHGDADNYAKTILDGLQGAGGALKDDRQVTELTTRIEPGEPGIHVTLEALGVLPDLQLTPISGTKETRL